MRQSLVGGLHPESTESCLSNLQITQFEFQVIGRRLYQKACATAAANSSISSWPAVGLALAAAATEVGEGEGAAAFGGSGEAAGTRGGGGLPDPGEV